MSQDAPTTTVSPTVRPTRSRTLLWFGVPIVVAAAALGAAFWVGLSGPCGGLLPGCGALVNAGEVEVEVRMTTDGTAQTVAVPPGSDLLLVGDTNDVWIGPGQCMTVEEGAMRWTAERFGQGASADGTWHPLPEGGARVDLVDRICQAKPPAD